MRVLITGAAGFIGGHLARRLADDHHEVVALDNLSAGVIENIDSRAEFHRDDIRSTSIYPRFARVDTVFHFAARNCLADCLADPVETAQINVAGTANVLEAARRAGVRKLVFADTSAEYEGVLRFPSVVEHVAPLSVYARSKRAAFLFCEAYQQFYGLTLTTLRYFNVYGPGQDWRRTIPPVMSAFAMKLIRGDRPVIYGNGEKRRDFVFIDDVTAFNLRTLTDPRTDNQVFNVGSGVNNSVNEIFTAVESILGTGLQPQYLDDLPGEAQETLADISVSTQLGWQPSIDLNAGIRRSIAHMRDHVLPCSRP